MTKPFAPAADRNKQFILDALQAELKQNDRVFEFGSGTGQHICHFARQRPDIIWQPSDLSNNLAGIRQWVIETAVSNVLEPIEFNLSNIKHEQPAVNVCYSANTLHIISWPEVVSLFQSAAAMLENAGKLCIYGPFRFHGKHISNGNEQFDTQLRSSNPQSGLRDVKDLDELALQHGFNPARISPLPANNHLLIWDRSND